MAEHYTKESEGKVGSVTTVEEALKAHHLATADPEPERGIGTETGPAHEKRFNLERHDESADHWRARGLDPYKNVGLHKADDDSDDDKPPAAIETGAKPPRAAKP